ncbi:UPF0598 protein CG30010 [Brevipalpus obovatus]|uniref:UPF0598 protein CG30010 n=1 Tax=Brevipalpus obovatus TaxID=246614 RepID=UPI003D9FA59B
MALNHHCKQLFGLVSRGWNSISRRSIHYVQGQSPQKGIREYFYFIDHQGMLFLDDSKMKNFTSCFKEKKFLAFFFSRLKMNDSGSYQMEFPYLSLCGREHNYVRCDDVPIVFTHSQRDGKGDWFLYYNHGTENMKHAFQPAEICMLPKSGRIYHPAPDRVGGVGLIKSSFAIEISKFFGYEGFEDDPPTSFTWDNTRYELTNNILSLIENDD